MNDELLNHCNAVIEELYERCRQNAPNYGVTHECFAASLYSALQRFAECADRDVTPSEAEHFLRQIQVEDLFLAIACANGNERAWWDFDREHRSFMERVARHLAHTDMDATDIVDTVYEQLYGTRIVDGERISKFSSYSGRGSLRGWLRTVIWHSLVDRHRAGHAEISLDEMTENIGEGAAQANFAMGTDSGEDAMIDAVARRRYAKCASEAIEGAFAALEPHERLILLYYHVDNLKLREIARLVENETSPLRAWFQRRSQSREQNPSGRIHESTVMRWLEKCYAKILESFQSRLREQFGLNEDEIALCTQHASEGLTGESLFRNLSTTRSATDVSN